MQANHSKPLLRVFVSASNLNFLSRFIVFVLQLGPVELQLNRTFFFEMFVDEVHLAQSDRTDNICRNV